MNVPGGAQVTTRPGVLSDKEIERLAREHQLIDPFEAHSVQGASYDMALGAEYAAAGQITRLTETNPSFSIEAGAFVVLTSDECLRMPDDVVGRVGLVSTWAQQGLVSLFEAQIDPGFRGRLVIPLFNAGNDRIVLRAGDRIFTLEFARMSTPTSRSWHRSHPPLLHISQGVADVQLASPGLTDITGRVQRLANDVTELRGRFDGFHAGRGDKHGSRQVILTWVAVVIALVSLAATVFQLFD